MKKFITYILKSQIIKQDKNGKRKVKYSTLNLTLPMREACHVKTAGTLVCYQLRTL